MVGRSMTTDPQDIGDPTAKGLSPLTRALLLLWTGLAAFIPASLAFFFCQREPTNLGYWLLSLVVFFIIPAWLLLSLSALGLWVPRLIARRRPTVGRVRLALAGFLAVGIASIATLTIVLIVCEQPAAQSVCDMVCLSYIYYAAWMCGSLVAPLALLPPFLGAIGPPVWWAAKPVSRTDKSP